MISGDKTQQRMIRRKGKKGGREEESTAEEKCRGKCNFNCWELFLIWIVFNWCFGEGEVFLNS